LYQVGRTVGNEPYLYLIENCLLKHSIGRKKKGKLIGVTLRGKCAWGRGGGVDEEQEPNHYWRKKRKILLACIWNYLRRKENRAGEASNRLKRKKNEGGKHYLRIRMKEKG